MTTDSSEKPPAFERVLGVRFLNARVERALRLLDNGGLMVVPAAPALVSMTNDPAYRRALAEADFAIVDSAFMAMLWLVLRGKRLHRVSGLRFLRELIKTDAVRVQGAMFLVNPSDDERDANLELLRENGFEISAEDCYTAPHYARQHIEDPALVEILEKRRPRFVMINLGGGTQEPLGLYLKNHLSFTTGIICTGAAIAFLTGRQTPISPLVDRLGLGWLWRSFGDPKRFVPRYAASVKLARLVYDHRENMPPTR